MNNINKEKNILKRIFKNPKIRKQISMGLILSVMVSSIIVIGYVLKASPVSVWAALCATQIGVALLWLIFRLGFNSPARHAARNSARHALNRKALKKEHKDKYLLKRSESPFELEQKDAKKSKAGIYTMLIIGAIYIIITLCVAYI